MIETRQPYKPLNTQHNSPGHLIERRGQIIPIALQILVISLLLRPDPHNSTLSLGYENSLYLIDLSLITIHNLAVMRNNSTSSHDRTRVDRGVVWAARWWVLKPSRRKAPRS